MKQLLSFYLIPSTPDGHCIIHSLVTCLNNTKNGNCCATDLLDLLKSNCILNYSMYLDYFDGDVNHFFKSMKDYVYDNIYDSSFCDLILYIMSNALDTRIVIFDRDQNYDDAIIIKPFAWNSDNNDGECESLFLSRKHKHYDACISVNDECSKNTSGMSNKFDKCVLGTYSIGGSNYKAKLYYIPSYLESTISLNQCNLTDKNSRLLLKDCHDRDLTEISPCSTSHHQSNNCLDTPVASSLTDGDCRADVSGSFVESQYTSNYDDVKGF